MRLYEAAPGGATALASATVTTSDPQEGSPIFFCSQAINPVTLAPGVTYAIAQDFTEFETLVATPLG